MSLSRSRGSVEIPIGTWEIVSVELGVSIRTPNIVESHKLKGVSQFKATRVKCELRDLVSLGKRHKIRFSTSSLETILLATGN